jgi:hypothetical protein
MEKKAKVGKGKKRAEWDKAYKFIFSTPLIVEQLMRKTAPGDWINDIDFSTLKKAPTEFITENLAETRNDVIWCAKFREQTIYIYIMIEFQSRNCFHMPVRMLAYVANLYLELIRSGNMEKGRKLPPVFPIVISNAPTPWKSPLSLSELINVPHKGLEKYIPSFSYYIFDEHEWIKQMDNPETILDLLLKIEFALREDIKTEKITSPEQIKEIQKKIMGYIDQLIELANGLPDEWKTLLRGFALLIKRALQKAGKTNVLIHEIDWDQISQPEEVGHMLETTMKTWYNQLAEYWEGKGEKKGIYWSITQIIYAKFKESGQSLIDRIQKIDDEATLQKVCTATALAQTPEEVMAVISDSVKS